MAATQQLEFTQAMQDFKTMFPGMEDGVIEAVLRSNQGAVDATIDQLLAMNTDYENEQLRHQLDEADGPCDTPDLIQSVAGATGASSSGLGSSATNGACGGASGGVEPDNIARLPRSPAHSSSLPLRELKGWDPPLLGSLPDDFLRLTPTHSRNKEAMLLSQQMLQAKYAENQRVRGVLGDSVADPELDQFLEDERIALFLQNAEFMAELRWNKDFLTALEKEQGSESPPNELPYKSSGGLHDDDLFRERLRNMGKVSRKKFAQLARMFTGRKKRSAKQILGHGAAPSKDSLLLNSEPLLSAEDDENEGDTSRDHSRDQSRDRSRDRI